jgi:hypothetical protein
MLSRTCRAREFISSSAVPCWGLCWPGLIASEISCAMSWTIASGCSGGLSFHLSLLADTTALFAMWTRRVKSEKSGKKIEHPGDLCLSESHISEKILMRSSPDGADSSRSRRDGLTPETLAELMQIDCALLQKSLIASRLVRSATEVLSSVIEVRAESPRFGLCPAR